MRETTLTITTSCLHGQHIVRGWTTSVPGLVVHHLDDDPCEQRFTGWAVDHERSGLLVSLADDPESAHARAAALGASGIDWTQPGAAIRLDPRYEEIRHIVRGGPTTDLTLQALAR